MTRLLPANQRAYSNGQFGAVHDLEGGRIQLWQPTTL